MTNQELQEQFKRCQEWQDPEQWLLLGICYLDRGYVLNAAHCLRQAKLCQSALTVQAPALGVPA